MVFIEKNQRGKKELKITHLRKEYSKYNLYKWNNYWITKDKYEVNILLQKQKLFSKGS